jgi:hypothetical protein
MGRRELAEVYGKNNNLSRNVNAAIRAELPGGNEALDALHAIASSRDATPGTQIEMALQYVRAIVNAMGNEIRSRYGVPVREESD